MGKEINVNTFVCSQLNYFLIYGPLKSVLCCPKFCVFQLIISGFYTTSAKKKIELNK